MKIDFPMEIPMIWRLLNYMVRKAVIIIEILHWVDYITTNINNIWLRVSVMLDDCLVVLLHSSLKRKCIWSMFNIYFQQIHVFSSSSKINASAPTVLIRS